jgi:hypothetical protein
VRGGDLQQRVAVRRCARDRLQREVAADARSVIDWPRTRAMMSGVPPAPTNTITVIGRVG